MRFYRRIKWLCVTITPFVWHWPHMDRGFEADHILRLGPISISGVFL